MSAPETMNQRKLIQHMPVKYSAVNHKNKKTYHVLGIAMDCTNTNPTVNHAMVIYTDDNFVGLYVRSRAEFEQKFSRLPK